VQKKSQWTPIYSITSSIATALMQIEAAKIEITHLRFTPAIEAELRHKARVRSTHFSTRIEGNRLTLKEAQDLIEKRKTHFHGRERDVNEVRNYWDAILKIEEWASQKMALTEDLIKRIHAIVERGHRAKPTRYRDGQNVIRDSGSGGIVYLPPEAKDVQELMAQMVKWIKLAEKNNIPVPIIASLLHYQFVTIHPYYDGNGRTARLLVTFILQRDGYGLNGFFSMEEHHAQDLKTYYDSLSVHDHHNYYHGRAHADLTSWVDYFVTSLAIVFNQVKKEAMDYAKNSTPAESKELMSLDRRAKVVLALFSVQENITSKDVARALGLSDRMVRLLVKKWVEEGWLVISNVSNRARAYKLSVKYRQFIGNL
jgi:Fic family protein